MKCQSCQDSDATIHFKEVVEGDLREIHLCESCASEKGFHLAIEQNKLTIASQFIWMAENLYPESSSKVGAVQCDECGLRYSQFTRIGRLGCPQCYTAFQTQLQQILRRVHGNVQHKGRLPGTDGVVATIAPPSGEQQLQVLKQKLRLAVEQEEFEEAARLRDEIRDVEQGQLGLDEPGEN